MREKEQKLCDAVACLFEQATDDVRSDISFPEIDGSGPPVEMRFTLAGRRIAIEHTLLEPFADAIRTGKEFQELTAEMALQLDGNLPKPGIYTLTFPIHPTKDQPRKKHKALRDAMIAWIGEAATQMHAEHPARLSRERSPRGYRGQRCTEIEGISLRLAREVRWAQSGRHDGRLFLVRSVGEDVEPLRGQRIATALDKKFPKLSECRAEGDETVLILEFSDISLTNHILIAQALEQELADRDCPDHIFIAETIGDEQWHLFHVVADKAFSLDLDYIEVDPSKH